MNADAQIPVALVEDDAELREATAQALELEGLAVTPYADAAAALSDLDAQFAGVVVTDVRMPRMDGFELFAELLERDPELPVILVTGHGDVPMAVDAMKRGAADFLTKPFAAAALVAAIRRAAAKRKLVIENRWLRDALRDRTSADLLGTSDTIRRLGRLVSGVAHTDLDVRVYGRPGMGKSHLARRIHDLSSRAERPFVTIDVGVWTNPDVELLVFGRDRAAGLSRSGLVERAQGGTLLLDDIETIPEALQGRIRMLFQQRMIHSLGAERPQAVNVRIVAVRSGEEAAAGEAARSLLDHLGGVSIMIPPLADRREDVAAIFRHFVDGFENEFSRKAPNLTAADWAFLAGHKWSGGLRELRDFARTFVLGLSRLTLVDDAPPDASTSLREMAAAFEKAVLEDALQKTGGRIEAVERLLSLKRKTLYDKLARHRLAPKDYR